MLDKHLSLNSPRQVLDNGLPVDELLRDESCRGEHGETAVLELLRLHGLELLGVLGAEPEGVEANVSGGVVVTEEELLVGVEGRDPANLGPKDLSNADGKNEDLPERRGNLGKVVDRRARDLRVEEEAGALNLLADEEAEEGEHGNTPVRELGLSEALALTLISSI